MREKICQFLVKGVATVFMFVVFASVFGLVDYIDSTKDKTFYQVASKTN